jgi:hypothetical protein
MGMYLCIPRLPDNPLESEAAMHTETKPGLPLNTFIVRFWRAPGTGQARWHGQVQHVQSGERAAFADEGALMSFIRRWVQTPEGKVLQRE